jgi:hypothetical protein
MYSIIRFIIGLLALRLFIFDRDKQSLPLSHDAKPTAPSWTQNVLSGLSALGSFGAFITSIAAAILAYQSLETTRDFRIRDENKDELQLTPIISVITHEFKKIDFENVGLGPAVVKQVYFRANDQYQSLKNSSLEIDIGPNKDRSATPYQKIFSFTFDLRLLEDIAKRHKIEYNFIPSGVAPLSNEIIRKDEKITLMEINSEDVLQNKSVTREERKAWIESVSIGSKLFNIGVCYASFTGKSLFYSALRGGVTHRKIESCDEAEREFRQ